MNASRDPDRLIQAFLREGPVQLQDRVYDAVRADIDVKRQRVFIGPWRMPTMYRPAISAAAAATVLVVAVVGYNLLPGLGIVGPGATPSPSLLARGEFVLRDWDRVEFVATRAGSSVTGSMTVGLKEGTADFLRVDLQCARTTGDGLIVIGGYTTDGDGRFASRPEGSFAAIALKRGSPVKAQVWAHGSLPGVPPTDCEANADAWLRQISATGEVSLRDDIEGTVEFGP